MRKRSPYTWAAMAVLLVPILMEGLRLVLNRPWPGFVSWNSHVVSAIVVTVMGATVFALFRGERSAIAERALAMIAPLLISGHALVLTTAKDRLGFVYIPVALLFVFFVQRALRAEGRILTHPPTREVLRGRMT